MKIIKTLKYKKAQFDTYDPQNIDADTGLPYGSPSLEDNAPNEYFTESSEGEIKNNPLNGKSNSQARKIVNKIIPDVKGIFSDNSWEAIGRIWDAFDISSLDWAIVDTEYLHDNLNRPTAKNWKIEIYFINDRGRDTTLYGTITAHGAGTVEDPLSRYDITAYVS